jgi:hypothetical protein
MMTSVRTSQAQYDRECQGGSDVVGCWHSVGTVLAWVGSMPVLSKNVDPQGTRSVHCSVPFLYCLTSGSGDAQKRRSGAADEIGRKPKNFQCYSLLQEPLCV